MIITVLSVSKTQHMTKANKPYSQLEVAYKGEDGQVKGKKLMPFGSSKPAFDALVSANSGESWDIHLVKEGEYWTWVTATRSSGSSGTVSTQETLQNTSTPVTQAPAGKVLGSNYETAAERAVKQRYIVRQSSIANAIDLRKSETANVEEILEVARIFEAFVFDELKAKPAADFSDMGDDVPL